MPVGMGKPLVHVLCVIAGACLPTEAVWAATGSDTGRSVSAKMAAAMKLRVDIVPSLNMFFPLFKCGFGNVANLWLAILANRAVLCG
jgi:hypothetical protein